MVDACSGGAKKVDPTADLALAQTAALNAVDLPGYKETSFTKSSAVPVSVKKDFAKCPHVVVSNSDKASGAQKDSSHFIKERVSLSSSVEIDPKKSDVDNTWAEFTNGSLMKGCTQGPAMRPGPAPVSCRRGSC